ncbi:MAG: hypothetical protein J0L89_04135 [Xanthomonadales bacterium]|nr:hypothetical protein [Xanthomonadales bacterium]
MTTVHVTIDPNIESNDLADLRLFHERVVSLANTALVKGNQSRIGASLSISRESGIVVRTTLPPEEQLAQFLMAFRFFYLKKEPTHFPRILNVVSKYADNSYREIAKTLKLQWKQSLFKNSATIRWNGQPLTAKQLIDLWFNAHYFHSDADKRTELARLNALMREDFCKFLLVDSTYNASDVVQRFHSGIGALFVQVGTTI